MLRSVCTSAKRHLTLTACPLVRHARLGHLKPFNIKMQSCGRSIVSAAVSTASAADLPTRSPTKEERATFLVQFREVLRAGPGLYTEEDVTLFAASFLLTLPPADRAEFHGQVSQVMEDVAAEASGPHDAKASSCEQRK